MGWRNRRGGTFTKETVVTKELFNFCKIGSRILPIIVEANPNTHLVSFIVDGKTVGSYKTTRRRMSYAIGDYMTKENVKKALGTDVLHLGGDRLVFFEDKLVDFNDLKRDFRRDVHNGLTLEKFDKEREFKKEYRSYGDVSSSLLTDLERCTLEYDDKTYNVVVFNQDDITLDINSLHLIHNKKLSFSSEHEELNVSSDNLSEIDIIDAILKFREKSSGVWKKQFKAVSYFFL